MVVIERVGEEEGMGEQGRRGIDEFGDAIGWDDPGVTLGSHNWRVRARNLDPQGEYRIRVIYRRTFKRVKIGGGSLMLAEAIAEPQVRVPSGFPKRKVWTRTECEILAKTGIVDTGKLELIEGDLIERMKNRPRVNAMMLVMEWLVGVFGFRYITSEGPVDVAPDDNPTSEPEPDLAVLEKPRSAYGAVNPKPSDILLLVEVSDTTLTFDRRIKAGLYARAGIVEYWVVDVEGRRIVVHRNPQGGTYTDVKSYGTGESIEPLAAPGKSFPVDSAFAG